MKLKLCVCDEDEKRVEVISVITAIKNYPEHFEQLLAVMTATHRIETTIQRMGKQQRPVKKTTDAEQLKF